MTKWTVEYIKADTHFTLHEDDPDLSTIKIRLPSPPSAKLIDGHGVKPENQKFKHQEYPHRLKRLEQLERDKLIKLYDSRRDQVFTEQKFIDRMWESLEEKKDEYEEELNWINRQIYHIQNGYWFYCKGKPTYITGFHYAYLNFWSSPDVPKKLEYRDRDRRAFLAAEYFWTTDEDEDGNHLGFRTFYGFLDPKHRRAGDTHKFLCAGYFDTLYRKGGHMGIQSFDEGNASTHFKNKLILAWQKFPFFLKPQWKGTNAPASSLFWGDNTIGEHPVLNTKITYATTADRKFYEGDTLTYLQNEEAGKTILEKVSERWGTQKETLGRADGAVIVGKVVFPTTVYEIDGEGGREFQILADQSNFFERIPNKKQTLSGLGIAFFPAYDGLEGFIGPYGESVIENPTPEQVKFLGKDYGAKEWLENANDILIQKGDSDSMDAYRERLRMYPMKFAHCFVTSSGDVGFNIKALMEAKSRLMNVKTPTVTRGDYYFLPDGGTPLSSKQILSSGMDIGRVGGRVVFEADQLNGRWEVTDTTGRNRRFKRGEHYFPLDPKICLGADPFNFQYKPSKASKKKGRSKGGGAMVRVRDLAVDPQDRDIKDWQTYSSLGYYKYRPDNNDEFAMDMLLAAIYNEAMVFPEDNIAVVIEKFLAWKFAGYLLFYKDPVTGKVKDKPGYSMQAKTKEELFQELNRYIDFRIHKEQILSFVNDCLSINHPDELRYYDGLAAMGCALMGAKSMESRNPKTPSDEGFDLGRLRKRKLL